jgi:hypothetical protein
MSLDDPRPGPNSSSLVFDALYAARTSLVRRRPSRRAIPASGSESANSAAALEVVDENLHARALHEGDRALVAPTVESHRFNATRTSVV